jgi:hypothetical protein
MDSPVVVQGTAVGASPQNDVGVPYGGTEVTQTNQEPSKTGCKDPLFALLFYLNVTAIIVVAAIYSKAAFTGDSGSDYVSSYVRSTSFGFGSKVIRFHFREEKNYSPHLTPASLLFRFIHRFVYAVLVFGGVSFVASGFGLLMLMACPALMIKAGLLFSIVVATAFTIYAFLYLNLIFGILGVVFLLMTLWYVKFVWSRIPFAAVNMLTAGTAIKANLGVTIFAIFFTLLSIGWLVLWSVAVYGVYDSTVVCDEVTGACSPNYGLLFLLFLSLFFTQQVLESCVHVTVAGTVGTWVSGIEKKQRSCLANLSSALTLDFD